MGGSAFASAPHSLYTPRMPPEVYRDVRARCREALGKLFRVVDSPVDGPAKKDFGDIDFLVAEPISLHTADTKPGIDKQSQRLGGSAHTAASGEAKVDGEDEIWSMIFTALGAQHTILRASDSSASLAVAWPEDIDESQPANVEASDIDKESPSPEMDTSPLQRFIQVDVRICPSVSRLRWVAFRHAHGDIWSILGTIIRPLGLTAGEDALYLRIPEIEELDKKKAKVFLTDDPDTAKAFLGLPEAEAYENEEDGRGGGDRRSYWEKPFDSYEDLFRYTASCRFFFLWPEPAEPDNAHPPKETSQAIGVADKSSARSKLKSNDRRRMNYRPLFRSWVEDFLPRNRASGVYPSPEELAAALQLAKQHQEPEAEGDEPQGPGAAKAASIKKLRAMVRDEAFARFPGSQQLYDSKLSAWTKQQQENQIKNVVIKENVTLEECAVLELAATAGDKKQSTAAPSTYIIGSGYRSIVLSALKKIILEGDASFGGIVPSAPLRTEEGYWLVEEAAAFVREKWRDVAPLAWEANRKRMADSIRLKELKRKAEAETRAAGAGDGGMDKVKPADREGKTDG